MSEFEIWKDVSGYEGYYQVSSHGRIKSLARMYTRTKSDGTTFKQSLPERVMSPGTTVAQKYPLVILCKDDVRTSRYVHEIVATEFIGPRPPGHQICHGPDGEINNAVSNLRYDTPRGNAADRQRDGTHAIGEQNPMNKFTVDEVYEVMNLLTHTDLQVKQIAAISSAKMAPQTVSGIKNGKLWQRAWDHYFRPTDEGEY